MISIHHSRIWLLHRCGASRAHHQCPLRRMARTGDVEDLETQPLPFERSNMPWSNLPNFGSAKMSKALGSLQIMSWFSHIFTHILNHYNWGEFQYYSIDPQVDSPVEVSLKLMKGEGSAPWLRREASGKGPLGGLGVWCCRAHRGKWWAAQRKSVGSVEVNMKDDSCMLSAKSWILRI